MKQVFVTKKTIAKMNRVFKSLEKQPKKFHMSYWGVAVKDLKKMPLHLVDQHGDPFIWLSYAAEDLERTTPPCGTVACLAGQIAIMAKLIKPRFSKKDNRFYVFNLKTPERAGKWLGLSPSLREKLFYPDNWPSNYKFQLNQYKPGTKEYLNVAKQRFNYLVKTGE